MSYYVLFLLNRYCVEFYVILCSVLVEPLLCRVLTWKCRILFFSLSSFIFPFPSLSLSLSSCSFFSLYHSFYLSLSFSFFISLIMFIFFSLSLLLSFPFLHFLRLGDNNQSNLFHVRCQHPDPRSPAYPVTLYRSHSHTH